MGGSRSRRGVEGCEARSDSTSRRNATITEFLAFLFATALFECTLFVAETTLFLAYLFLDHGDIDGVERGQRLGDFLPGSCRHHTVPTLS